MAISSNAKNPPKSSKSSDCPVSKRFPKEILKWCETISTHSQKNGIDANLVASVILVESAGKENAVSGSGAIGLMQIMPSDGKAASFQCANGPCFSDRPSTKKLLDPNFNVSFGTRMLSRLIKQKGGDLEEALKSYGPMDQQGYYSSKVLKLYKKYK